jgi:hypothetical protein
LLQPGRAIAIASAEERATNLCIFQTPNLWRENGPLRDLRVQWPRPLLSRTPMRGPLEKFQHLNMKKVNCR